MMLNKDTEVSDFEGPANETNGKMSARGPMDKCIVTGFSENGAGNFEASIWLPGTPDRLWGSFFPLYLKFAMQYDCLTILS